VKADSKLPAKREISPIAPPPPTSASTALVDVRSCFRAPPHEEPGSANRTAKKPLDFRVPEEQNFSNCLVQERVCGNVIQPESPRQPENFWQPSNRQTFFNSPWGGLLKTPQEKKSNIQAEVSTLTVEQP